MSANLAIEATGLSKSFGRISPVYAVRDVSLCVSPGEVVGLVGSNGAGKSTLLKLLCGLVPRNAGTLSVLGTPRADCESDPRLGVLIEGACVYRNLDPFENLMARALVMGLPDPKRACKEALDLVGLGPKVAGDGKFRLLWPRGAYAGNLSQGLTQRLGVALALLGDPPILVLDEPFNGMDPATTKSVRDLLARLARERGTTVIISSHTLSHLERICTRFCIMREGGLVKDVSADELKAARSVRLVAEVTECERAVAVLAEELPGLGVTVLDDGRLSVVAPSSEAPDRRVFSQTLLEAGIGVTELVLVKPDLEAELVGLMQGGRAAKKG